MSEFDFEPVQGLPENLPEGERLRWQGAPTLGGLALRAFHVRKVALYFGLLVLFRIGFVLYGGGPLKDALISGLWLIILSSMAIGILMLLAWLYSRSTVYSITDRRLVIRFGVAVPIAVNIPFKVIETAGLRRHPDGSGDIPLGLGDDQSVNYLIMWPNVRPWRFLDAQPMLRAIPEVDKVAEILSQALKEATGNDGREEVAQQAIGAASGAGEPLASR